MQRVRKCSSKWSLNNQRFSHQSTHMKPNGQFEIMDYCKAHNHLSAFEPCPKIQFRMNCSWRHSSVESPCFFWSLCFPVEEDKSKRSSHTSSRRAYEAQSHNEHFLLTQEDNSSAICWRVRKRSHRVLAKTDVSDATWSIPVREISDDCDQRTVTCCEIEH
jgi:hypothetical protein